MQESAGDGLGDTYSISSGKYCLSLPLGTGTSSWETCAAWAAVVGGGAGDLDLDLVCGFDAVSITTMGFAVLALSLARAHSSSICNATLVFAHGTNICITTLVFLLV